MKKLALLFATSAICVWPQSQTPLDLSSLDKLASKASQANEVNLDANQIHAAMQFLSQDDGNSKKDQARKLMSGLQNVTVRNFEFAQPGAYLDSDLAPIRTQLSKLKGWGKIVDSKEKTEHSEVYMLTEGDKTTGIAVINLEPRELTVVLLRGPIELADLDKFHGLMGVPNIQIGPQPRNAPKPTP